MRKKRKRSISIFILCGGVELFLSSRPVGRVLGQHAVKKNGAMRIGCSASLCLSFLVLGRAQLEAEQKKSAQPGLSFLVLGRARLEAEPKSSAQPEAYRRKTTQHMGIEPAS